MYSVLFGHTQKSKQKRLSIKACKLSRCTSEQNQGLQHQVDFSHFPYLAILSGNVHYFEIGSSQVKCDTFCVESIKVALIY